MVKLSGGCQCGDVRFEVEGELHFACVCHCPSCRKATGAPIVGWAMFEQSALSCDRQNVQVYQSSKGVERSFCSTCGTTLFFESEFIPGLIDITTESFDDPDVVKPTAHIWTIHETKCAKSLSGLHRFEELPPQD